jgi:hypothetical protein
MVRFCLPPDLLWHLAEELKADYYENVLSFTKVCTNFSYFFIAVFMPNFLHRKKSRHKKTMCPPNWVIGRIHHKSLLNCTPGRIQRPGVLVMVAYFTI